MIRLSCPRHEMMSNSMTTKPAVRLINKVSALPVWLKSSSGMWQLKNAAVKKATEPSALFNFLSVWCGPQSSWLRKPTVAYSTTS